MLASPKSLIFMISAQLNSRNPSTSVENSSVNLEKRRTTADFKAKMLK